jgi:hypothetical protein
VSQPTLPSSPFPFPPDRPRWAVLTVRIIQTVLAVLALAVLALSTVARPAPDPAPAASWRALLVTDTTRTTLHPPGYVPTPAGPPCPAPDAEGSR